MFFSIRDSTDGQYYFVIKSDNNEVVAISETYHYKSSAQRTIDSIKKNINVNTHVVDMTK